MVEAITPPRTSHRYAQNVILVLGIISLIIGFIYTPSVSELWEGLQEIMFAHMRADSEPFTIGGSFGPVWINAGLIQILVWITHKIFKTTPVGADYASSVLTFGFSFYGINIINIIFPLLGAFAASLILKKNMKEFVGLAWFGMGIAPMVSTLAFHTPQLDPYSLTAYTVAIVVGFVLGFLIIPFYDLSRALHKGRIVFNAGFAASMVGVLGYTIVKGLGLQFAPVTDQIYLQANTDGHLFLVFMLINLYFFAAGAIFNGGFTEYFKKYFLKQQDGGDLLKEYGLGNVLIHISVVGTLALSIAHFILPAAEITGVVVASIYIVAGFSAIGITVMNAVPLVAGVIIGAFLFGGTGAVLNGGTFLAGGFAHMNSRGMTVAAIQVMGASPVAKRDGWIAAFIVGALHQIVLPNLGAHHGWVVLYNNAYSLGTILIFFMPIWFYFSKKRQGSLID